MTWFFYTICTLLIYGFIDFFYKVAANHNCSSSRVLFFASGMVTVLSLIAVLVTGSSFADFRTILLFALLNSSFFASGIIFKVSSLKRAPAGIIFPLTKINSIFLILIAVIFLGERLLLKQWLGISISICMVIYINFNLKDEAEKKIFFPKAKQRIGVLFAIFATISTAISMLAGKFASERVPIFSYMLLSYFLVWFNMLWLNRFVTGDKEKSSHDFRFGLLIGTLNFLGYFCFLQAVGLGPLSLVQGINSNVFIIPIVLSIIFYKEKFDFRKAIILALTVVSIFLIKS